MVSRKAGKDNHVKFAKTCRIKYCYRVIFVVLIEKAFFMGVCKLSQHSAHTITIRLKGKTGSDTDRGGRF
jgi:hypothetical protein